MPSSIYDFEQYATACFQDSSRWDLFLSSIANVKYNVPKAKSITLTAADAANLPGIAALHLGSRYLWYVLLHYNGLYNSVEDVTPGMTINIPDITSLLAYLKRNTSATSAGFNNAVLVL